MYILTSSTVNLNKVVNSLGKAIYKRLEGSYSFKKTSNMYEIKSTILYQIPKQISDKYNLVDEERNRVNVMDVTVNITTYSDKIRVEVIEVTPEEKTIAFKTFKSDWFDNVQTGINYVYSFITSSIEKEFNGYELLF